MAVFLCANAKTAIADVKETIKSGVLKKYTEAAAENGDTVSIQKCDTYITTDKNEQEVNHEISDS